MVDSNVVLALGGGLPFDSANLVKDSIAGSDGEMVIAGTTEFQVAAFCRLDLRSITRLALPVERSI